MTNLIIIILTATIITYTHRIITKKENQKRKTKNYGWKYFQQKDYSKWKLWFNLGIIDLKN